MRGETKNMITRESVKKDLIFSAKRLLVIDCIALVLLSLLMALLIYASLFAARYVLVVGLLLALIFLIPPILGAFYVIRDIRNLRLAARGGFLIVTDTVCDLVKGEPIGRHSVADAIYFKRYGRWIAADTTFGLTSVGDEFYLVVLQNKKKEIKMAFHSLMYRCDEVTRE